MYGITTTNILYPTLRGAMIANSRAASGAANYPSGIIMKARLSKSITGHGLVLVDQDGTPISTAANRINIYQNKHAAMIAQARLGGTMLGVILRPLSQRDTQKVAA